MSRERRPFLLRAEVVGVDRHLLGPPRPAQVVYAGVLRDLVDPGAEGDLLLGAAQGPQRRHEGLLDDVLRAAVVGDHAPHVAHDPVPVAQEQGLEGGITAVSCRGHELLVARLGCCSGQERLHRVPLAPFGIGGASSPRPHDWDIPARHLSRRRGVMHPYDRPRPSLTHPLKAV